MDTMEEVKVGKYQKKLVSSSSVDDNKKSQLPDTLAAKTELMSVLEGRGKIIESEEIRFDSVPLISPNGDVLVKSMSFNVEPGVSFSHPLYHSPADVQKHLLVVGPNGCEPLPL